MNVVEEFIKLLDSELNESVYQKYLEDHTELIPTKPFELNHGVLGDLIIKKMPIGNDYISDFCYLSKDSGNWNIVFIEIEKPGDRLFNKDNTMSKEFNKGISQINDWRTYFSDNTNREAFIKNNVISELMNINPLFRKPVNFKYILIIGRRKEIIDVHQRNIKFHQSMPDDSKVMTYDSLYESIHQKQAKYIGVIKEQKLYIQNDNYVSSMLFQYTNPNYICIKQSLFNELEKYKNPKEGKFGGLSYNEYIEYSKFDTLKYNIF